jgi:hypothetical protein
MTESIERSRVNPVETVIQRGVHCKDRVVLVLPPHASIPTPPPLAPAPIPMGVRAEVVGRISVLRNPRLNTIRASLLPMKFVRSPEKSGATRSCSRSAVNRRGKCSQILLDSDSRRTL